MMDKTVELLEKHGTQLNDFIFKMNSKTGEFVDRLMDVEQKIARRPGGSGPIGDGGASLAQEVTNHASFSALASGEVKDLRLRVNHAPFETKNTILGSSTLVPADRRPEITAPMERVFSLRSLIPVVKTTSSSIEATRELVFSNAAGPQWESSPVLTEGAQKAESSLTFELIQRPIVTVAHWLSASRQILSDQPMLQNYIDTRLIYGLALEEERELLLGSGSAGEMYGLTSSGSYTSYSRGSTGDNKLDAIRKAATQLQVQNHSRADAIILSPQDFEAIELLKTTTNEYLVGTPRDGAADRLWGTPVIATNAMSQGSFIVADLAHSATIYQREETTIEISTSHSDFFTRNLVAILAEMRECLVVHRPLGIVYGSLPA